MAAQAEAQAQAQAEAQAQALAEEEEETTNFAVTFHGIARGAAKVGEDPEDALVRWCVSEQCCMMLNCHAHV